MAMAIGAGMTSAITNPLNADVMAAILGADVLMGHDPHCDRWIRRYRDPEAGGQRADRPRRRRRGGGSD